MILQVTIATECENLELVQSDSQKKGLICKVWPTVKLENRLSGFIESQSLSRELVWVKFLTSCMRISSSQTEIMLTAIFILSLSSLTLAIEIEEAKRFDKMSEIRTAEDYQRYIDSIRKIYLKQGVMRFGMPGSFSPDNRAGSPFQTLLSGERELARPAACIPEQTIVPVEVSGVQAGEIVIPSCTRVQRCGGCCSHPLLSCQPTSSDIVTTNALVIDIVSGANRCIIMSRMMKETFLLSEWLRQTWPVIWVVDVTVLCRNIIVTIFRNIILRSAGEET